MLVTCPVTTTQDKHIKTYKSFGIVGEVQVWMLWIDTQEVKKYFRFTKFGSECLLSYLKSEQYDMESTSCDFNNMKDPNITHKHYDCPCAKSGGIAPLILNLNTMCRLVVAACLGRFNPRYPFKKRFCGPLSHHSCAVYLQNLILIHREESGLKVLGNKVLRRILGRRMKER